MKSGPAVIAALLVSTLLSSCGGGDAPPAAPLLEIQVAPVQKLDLPLSREFVGRTVGSIDADVRARIEGTLIGMYFDEGGEVSEGQILYEVDPAPFITAVAAAKGTLAEAETRLAQTIADFKRVKPLAAIDAVSQRELDLAEANRGVAEGALEAAKAGVRAAEIELGYTKIQSPASGTIGFTKAHIGEFVGRPPNALILNTVSKLDPIDVQFSLSEKEYLYFARMSAENGRQDRKLQMILADGSINPGYGTIAKVDRSIEAQSGGIRVEASFPNPQKILRPGLFAKVRTVAEIVPGALLVPRKAIKEVQGRYFVFVVDPSGIVDQRSVEVGPTSGDLQVIESGISESEQVAIDGIQRLRSGATVKPKILNLPK